MSDRRNEYITEALKKLNLAEVSLGAASLVAEAAGDRESAAELTNAVSALNSIITRLTKLKYRIASKAVES